MDVAWRAARWPRHAGQPHGDRRASLFDLGDILGIILISRLAGRPSMLEIYFLKSFNVGDIVPVTKTRKTVDGPW